MDYQVAPTACPKCGGSENVHNARELFGMMNGTQQQGFQGLSQIFGGLGQAAGQGGFPGPGQAAGQGGFPQGTFSGPGQGQAPGPGQATPPPPRGGFRQGSYTAQGQEQAAAQGGFPQGQFFGQAQDQEQRQSPAQDQQAAAPQPPHPGQAQPPHEGQAQPPYQGQAQPPYEGQPQPPHQGQAQPPYEGQAAGQGQNAGSGGNRDNNDDYDHYNADPGNQGLRGYLSRNRRREGFGLSDIGDNIADDIGGAVLGAALGFAGKRIGRKMKQAFEEKVVPAMQAKMEQAQQLTTQQKAELDAIAARYPELHGCMKDQVIFLDGGYRTLPVSELKLPLTLAQADAVVLQLR